MIYLTDPVYAGGSSQKGGASVTVVLGPFAWRSRGDSADPNLPSAIKEAGKEYTNENFIAGHLLNGEFGGPGKDWRNLTILTSSSNGKNKRFDEPLKRAVAELKKLYSALHADASVGVDDLTGVGIGIQLTVTVDQTDAWNNNSYPGDSVFKKIVWNAACVEGNLADLPNVTSRTIAAIKTYTNTAKDLIRTANGNGTIEQIPNG